MEVTYTKKKKKNRESNGAEWAWTAAHPALKAGKIKIKEARR